jgi:hypothetical protein
VVKGDPRDRVMRKVVLIWALMEAVVVAIGLAVGAPWADHPDTPAALAGSGGALNPPTALRHDASTRAAKPS